MSILVLLACMWISYLQVDAATNPLWNVNVSDLMEDVKTKPIPTLVSDLTQKMTGEFDKMYHQLEGVLGQLKEGWGTREVEAQLDPETLSRCSCYCRCPHDTGESKVVSEVKNSVQELKKKLENLGRSFKDKIHLMTSL
ncbi:uncharacterized protein LOC128991289 isoform X1 [Macrosteles quadrilineatus]|uniref:uncharacterized protein LOC128991289 isoform X1 n=2 Tax=Macrosteles quadrilineatus TaxID=74068 RepID=UPI0023E0DAE4|nr:uncharacterized protein LOC128991289 isoform X1 [Macrosteles quadrilineatus]